MFLLSHTLRVRILYLFQDRVSTSYYQSVELTRTLCPWLMNWFRKWFYFVSSTSLMRRDAAQRRSNNSSRFSFVMAWKSLDRWLISGWLFFTMRKKVYLIVLQRNVVLRNVFVVPELHLDPCLGFWCMDCSIAMQMLLSTGVSSIIFTS